MQGNPSSMKLCLLSNCIQYLIESRVLKMEETGKKRTQRLAGFDERDSKHE